MSVYSLTAEGFSFEKAISEKNIFFHIHTDFAAAPMEKKYERVKVVLLTHELMKSSFL